MAFRKLPPAEYLRQLFSYDLETGVLTWRVRPLEHFKSDRERKRWNSRYAGTQAGSLGGPLHHIAVWVIISKKSYLAHRLIWKLVSGTDPTEQIDHIDRCPTNNAWANLRQATDSQQNGNKGLMKTNTSGVRGVTWYPKTGKWLVQIGRGKRYGIMPKNLGFYDTLEEAKDVYDAAAKVFFGEFYKG